MHFRYTHKSLPIARAEDHKCAHLNVEEGVCLALDARQRAEEGEHARIEAEEEAQIVEEARLKFEED